MVQGFCDEKFIEAQDAFENSIKLVEVPLSIMKRLEPRITKDIYKVL